VRQLGAQASNNRRRVLRLDLCDECVDLASAAHQRAVRDWLAEAQRLGRRLGQRHPPDIDLYPPGFDRDLDQVACPRPPLHEQVRERPNHGALDLSLQRPFAVA
jgi:hypothetical protein